MTQEIKNPKQTTYFICREDDTFTITSYGSVQPHQIMKTGQPIMDTYLDELEWESVLLKAGINLKENIENV